MAPSRVEPCVIPRERKDQPTRRFTKRSQIVSMEPKQFFPVAATKRKNEPIGDEGRAVTEDIAELPNEAKLPRWNLRFFIEVLKTHKMPGENSATCTDTRKAPPRRSGSLSRRRYRHLVD